MIPVILAAGMSTRLRPRTDTLPKPLLPVGETPLLRRTLQVLHLHGFQQCVIVTGYHRGLIEQSVQEWNASFFPHIRFVFNPRFASTNNNYSLWCARSDVLGQEMLLLDADIFFHEKVLEQLLLSPHENALVVRRARDLGPEEIKVELDLSGRVIRIGKTVAPDQAGGESLGIEKFSASATRCLFDVLRRRKDRDEFYEASFQELIDAGTEIFAVGDGGYPCIEIDTEEDLANADRLAKSMQP